MFSVKKQDTHTSRVPGVNLFPASPLPDIVEERAETQVYNLSNHGVW